MVSRSTTVGVPAMSAGDLDDVPNGGGREWAAFEDTATYQIFGEAWRDRIERSRRAMTFSEGKRLAHRVFDTLGMPRPYVKCMPGHYRLLGYATPEWEIFIRQETWDDTVLHEAAHLMFWENAGGQPDGDIMEGHSLVWFSNYYNPLEERPLFGRISCGKGLPCLGPLEGLGESAVEVVDELLDPRLQVLLGGEAAAPQ